MQSLLKKNGQEVHRFREEVFNFTFEITDLEELLGDVRGVEYEKNYTRNETFRNKQCKPMWKFRSSQSLKSYCSDSGESPGNLLF